MNKPPEKIIRVRGHDFHLTLHYDADYGARRTDYPDFDVNPVYTADGRPFRLSAQESCPQGKHYECQNQRPYDCNECVHFHQEAPADAIGICMCEELERSCVDMYISAEAAAQKWGITPRQVQRHLAAGRVPGGRKFGRSWLIPAEATKPEDARREKSPKNALFSDLPYVIAATTTPSTP